MEALLKKAKSNFFVIAKHNDRKDEEFETKEKNLTQISMKARAFANVVQQYLTFLKQSGEFLSKSIKAGIQAIPEEDLALHSMGNKFDEQSQVVFKADFVASHKLKTIVYPTLMTICNKANEIYNIGSQRRDSFIIMTESDLSIEKAKAKGEVPPKLNEKNQAAHKDFEQLSVEFNNQYDQFIEQAKKEFENAFNAFNYYVLAASKIQFMSLNENITEFPFDSLSSEYGELTPEIYDQIQADIAKENEEKEKQSKIPRDFNKFMMKKIDDFIPKKEEKPAEKETKEEPAEKETKEEPQEEAKE